MGLGLAPDGPSNKTPPPAQRHLALAKALQGALRKLGKGGGRTPAWAKDLAGCEREQCCGSAARLEAALLWYCGKLAAKDKYLPQAWSASGFRRKFHQIEEAMKRDELRNPSFTVSPTASKVVEQCRHLKWPPSVKDQLPLHAQAVIERYGRTRIHIQECVQKTAEGQTRRVLARLLAALPVPQTYAVQYLTEIVHRRATWDKFNGDLSPLFWTRAAPHFLERCKKIVTDYGAGSLWPAVEKEVSGE